MMLTVNRRRKSALLARLFSLMKARNKQKDGRNAVQVLRQGR
ncbi:hypothetical protein [Erwinia tasmaniensis]|nr:hypothetical protein [Erwinia tasmaniensis]